MSEIEVRRCKCSICVSTEEHPDKELHYQINLFLSRLDEQQRRWYVALEAKKIGHGGAKLMPQITGMSLPTIRRGRQELENGLIGRPIESVRSPGAGRPLIEKKSPEVEKALESLVEDSVAGDPMTDRKDVRKSLRKISKKLQSEGYQVSPPTVRRLLKQNDYSLQANRKSLTGNSHPDEKIQLTYIRRVKKLFLRAGHPVISVDSKKKELIGNFKNNGRTWRRKAKLVNKYDFRNQAIGRGCPYGVYDLKHKLGYVYVGISYDTPEFAVDSIALWWQDPHRPSFANENCLLILADAGGSNGYRPRMWKRQLQTELADKFGLTIMVCHYPSGGSKYNPIERELFSYISINWAGEPLDSFETMLGYIRDTETESGLKVYASMIDKKYERGKKVSDAEMADLNLIRRRICPMWNYIIKPRVSNIS